MKMQTLLAGAALLWVGGFLAASKAAGQAADGTDETAALVVRVYPVADLVKPRTDYPYLGGLPTATDTLKARGSVGSFGGGSGGGFRITGGGLGPFGGGGMGSGAGSARNQSGLRFTIGDLQVAIETTVEPNSWATMGGDAVITALGRMLVIRQTEAAHEQIETLLQSIRSQGGTLETVTVEAHWLLLEPEQLEQLFAIPNNHDSSDAVNAGQAGAVDPDTLASLTGEVPGFKGRVTCLSDQTVHIVSGNRRTVIASATPSVAFATVGYTPQIHVANIGVLLEVSPSVLPGDEAALVDLQSTVTGWGEPGDPVQLGSRIRAVEVSQEPGGSVPMSPDSSSVSIDRVNMPAQQLATTVRIPLATPVLVGGLSVVGVEQNVAAPRPDEQQQLYLIIQVSRAE